MARFDARLILIVAVSYLVAVEALARLADVTAGVLYLPAAGLSIYLLFRFGIAYAPLIVAAELLFRVLFAGAEQHLLPVLSVLEISVTKAICYVAAVAVLRYVLGVSATLRSSRDLALFFVIAGGLASYVIALFTTASLIRNGLFPAALFSPVLQNTWLGYSTGIITGYPLLIYFIEPLIRDGKALLRESPMLERWSWILVLTQYTILAAVLLYALHAYLRSGDINEVYLVLPIFPMAWIALRRGLFATGFACFAVATTTIAYVRLANASLSLHSTTELQRFFLINSLVTFAFAAVSSERAQVTKRLTRSEWSLEQARESSLMMTAELSTAGLFQDSSRYFREVFGVAKDDMGKTSLLDLVHPDEKGAAETALSEVSSQGNSVERTIRLKNAAGEWIWVDLVLTAARSVEGDVEWILTFLRDVTGQKRTEEELARSAYFDHLTGLANRLHLEDSLQQSIARTKREGTTLALLYIDLDHFKPINDTYGHVVGDKLLVDVAERLKHSIRGSDIAARFGGDEFIVVLQDIHPASQLGNSILARAAAYQRASDILSALRSPFLINQTTASLDASIGISILGEDAHDIASLLRNADAAMYRAKQTGKGGIELFSRRVRRSSIGVTEAAKRVSTGLGEPSS